MYAIIGEDKSDVEMINTLIRRIDGNENLSVKRMGFNGCADMLNKGSRQLKLFSKVGCTRFIICYDSDGDNANVRYQKVVKDVILKSGVKGSFCALIPVEEIESWILSDLKAVSNIIPSWKPKEIFHHPESCKDPKEYLEKISRGENLKPLYSHSIHNSKVAKYLDLELLANKCPSSLPLFEIVKNGEGNHPRLPLDKQTEDYKKIIEKMFPKKKHQE